MSAAQVTASLRDRTRPAARRAHQPRERTGASQPGRRSRAQLAAPCECGFTVESGPQNGCGPIGMMRLTKRQGRDPEPCSPCMAPVSRAVDACMHIELGSYAKPGLHTRRLPVQACDGASSHMVSCALPKGAACSIRSNRFDADKLVPLGSHLSPGLPVSIGCSVASADRNRSLLMARRVIRLNAEGRIDLTTTYVPRVMPMRLGRTFNRRKDNELRGKSKTPPLYQSRLGLNPT